MTKDKPKKIFPLGDRVLIKPIATDELATKTNSGIIIPDTVSKEKPEQGKVLAVGEGRYEDGKLIKPRVKEGDRVLFSKYGYDEVKVDDEELFIIKEENILAIIK
ncbi:MAG: chaperonin GroES [Parcubacteria group bacterium Gr01-1014_73]|nr:MAG: chaperonin GroES [Parcubacteria group bacterium Gr01-1014_73]